MASAVAMQKATVQEDVRAQETRIPLDLPQRTCDGYEGQASSGEPLEVLRRGPVSLTYLHKPPTYS